MRRYLFLTLLLAACGDNGIKPDAHPRIDSGETQDDGPIDHDAPLQDGSNAGSDAGSGSAGSDAGTAPVDSAVWVVGDFQTDNVTVAGRFLSTDTTPITTFTVTPDGARKLATSGVTQFVFDVSADSSKTAYVANSAGNATQFDLYVADKDGANETLLVSGAGVVISSIAFSPDGTKIAYTSDSVAIPGGFDLFVVNTEGVPLPVKVSPDRAVVATPNALDVFTQFTWSPDSKFLGFTADLTVDNKSEAYVVDTSVALPIAVDVLPAANITAPSVGSRGTLQWAGTKSFFFRASVDGSAQFKLFEGKTDGSLIDHTADIPLRGDNSVPDVGALATTHDGTKLVVSFDAPTLDAYDLYVTATATVDPTKLTNLAAAGNASFTIPLFISPDDTQVAYVNDFAASGVNEISVTKLDGTDTHRLVQNAVANSDAEWLQWSLDGTKIYGQGDLAVNNDTAVFVLDPTATDQDITNLTAVGVPANGDIKNVIVRPIAQ